MRYYRIEISDPASGQVVVPPGFSAALLGGATYTSYVNGRTLPEAWNVELDVPVIGGATPQGQALARVWGVSLAEIGQANDLNGKNVKIFAGMQKGLPLAKPAQSGLIVQGTIFQAFGNWIDTDQTLDLVIIPGSGTGSQSGGLGSVDAPKNVVLNWKAGTPMGDALKSALSTAFPQMTINVSLSSKLVRSNDEVGFFPGLEQLAQYALQQSLSIVKTPGYPGVSIVPSGNAINVLDGTVSGGSVKKIAFEDLIGQPTWIEAPNIQAKAVMRADLSVGDEIQLPPAVVTNTANAASSLLNQRSIFQGTFTIVSERHVGNFRAPAADGWVTVIEAAPNAVAPA